MNRPCISSSIQDERNKLKGTANHMIPSLKQILQLT